MSCQVSASLISKTDYNANVKVRSLVDVQVSVDGAVRHGDDKVGWTGRTGPGPAPRLSYESHPRPCRLALPDCEAGGVVWGGGGEEEEQQQHQHGRASPRQAALHHRFSLTGAVWHPLCAGRAARSY